MAAPAEIAIIGGGPAGLALAAIFEHSNVSISYIVYERSSLSTPPRGGCLDLHEGSGQLAMQEAGCYEKFRECGRAGNASINRVWNPVGEKVFEYGEGNDSPELDREQIKQVLLSTVPKEKIVWEKKVKSAEREGNGEIVIKFEDGSEVKGFQLVVGADGVNSKIRHLVTDAKPKYSGITFWTGLMHADNPFYPTLEKTAKEGPMIIFGRNTMIWIQRQGDGHYRIEHGIQRPIDFKPVDFADVEAVKKVLLSDELFGGHGQIIKDIIAAAEGPYHPWPLWYMPPEKLDWKAKNDVTLIGDSAHVTTPFVGEGVNVALLDTVMLARKLKEFGVGEMAVEEYEKNMFVRAKDVIERSVASGELYFEWDAPKSIRDAAMKGDVYGGIGSV